MIYADLSEEDKQRIRRRARENWNRLPKEEKTRRKAMSQLRAKERLARATPEQKALHWRKRRAMPSKSSEKNKEQARGWRAKNPGYSAKRYGVSLPDFEKMVAAQNGKCAICGKVPKKLCVDHCHTTNKVRGLLCRKCNSGIGFFGDDFYMVIRAASYLRRTA